MKWKCSKPFWMNNKKLIVEGLVDFIKELKDKVDLLLPVQMKFNFVFCKVKTEILLYFVFFGFFWVKLKYFNSIEIPKSMTNVQKKICRQLR